MRTLLLCLSLLCSLDLSAAEPKPKYGPPGAPRATPLALAHEYFRTHPAPGYWTLIGYYVPQINDYACSAASVAMIINAARAALSKTADDKLIGQSELLERVTVEHWKDRLDQRGFEGEHGLGLERLANVTRAAFKAYGFPSVQAEAIHVQNTSPETKKKLLRALKKNEGSAEDYILINFDQKAFTDDADIGHIAPVAAFDAKTERVLVLDPDREYYEPYWVSVDTLLSGMATRDAGGKAYRGYLIVRPNG